MNYIESVGCEIECGIKSVDFLHELYKQAYGKVRSFAIGEDGSVKVYNCYIDNAEIKFWFYYPSEFEKAKEFIQFLFQRIKQNETCGNHVHVKFFEEVYKIITFKKFFTEFKKLYIQNFKDEEKYIKRLYSKWCKYVYDQSIIEEQLTYSYRNANRYTSINFNSLKAYNTIEFRILPYVESSEEYLRNLEWLINTINNILEKIFKKSLLYNNLIELSCLGDQEIEKKILIHNDKKIRDKKIVIRKVF